MADERKGEQEKHGGLGKALRQAVGYEELGEDEKRRERGRESILMNEARQDIFQLLCDRPCAHLRLVARVLKISAPTADWHLGKLVRAGIVSRQMVGKKRVYFPKDFVALGDIKTFAMLNKELPRKILQELTAEPGLSQTDLRQRLSKGAMSRCLSDMRDCGILDTITSGRFVHYYIDKGLLARDREYAGRMRQFRRETLKRFARDGLSPRIVRARENRIEIEVMSGPRTRQLVIHTRPFAFLLAGFR
jgi:DNA-binding transcriptional ArsR family regulator